VRDFYALDNLRYSVGALAARAGRSCGGGALSILLLAIAVIGLVIRLIQGRA
jgi:hypothetical protein